VGWLCFIWRENTTGSKQVDFLIFWDMLHFHKCKILQKSGNTDDQLDHIYFTFNPKEMQFLWNKVLWAENKNTCSQLGNSLEQNMNESTSTEKPMGSSCYMTILVGDSKNNHWTIPVLCKEEERHLERDFRTDRKGDWASRD